MAAEQGHVQVPHTSEWITVSRSRRSKCLFINPIQLLQVVIIFRNTAACDGHSCWNFSRRGKSAEEYNRQRRTGNVSLAGPGLGKHQTIEAIRMWCRRAAIAITSATARQLSIVCASASTPWAEFCIRIGMASAKDTATFFTHGTCQQYEQVLKLYPQALRLKADRKAKKPEELIKLDNWWVFHFVCVSLNPSSTRL